MTLGKKIRQFRKRAGLSQLSLELAIEASPGSLSRIENGKVNPTKETIIEIARVLKLKTAEIASLFGLEIYDRNHLFEEVTEILSTHSLQEVLDRPLSSLSLSLTRDTSNLTVKAIKEKRVYFTHHNRLP